MYCEKCGNEIKDNEVICTQCGCIINNFDDKCLLNNYSSDMPSAKIIKTADDLEKDIKTCKIFAIIAAVLFLGIGIIFSYLFLFMQRKILNTEYEGITNAGNIVQQELNKYRMLSSIPGIVGLAVLALSPIILIIAN